MQLSNEDRRALGVVLGLLVLASAARWLERPRPVLEELQALDVAALEAASRDARPEPRSPLRAGERLDPNTASPQDLQRLPGVGQATADRIVAEREVAPFRSVADLERVRGIGPALTARLAEHLSLPVTAPAVAGTPAMVGATSSPAGVVTRPAAPARASPGTGGRVDLNSAGLAELQVVRGIGPALAARLVARRDSLGGFRDWADVDAVAGVGPAMLARLQEEATLGPRRGHAP